MTMVAKTADERAFLEHVAGVPFVDGVERGRWRIVGERDWPHVLIALTAAPSETGPSEFFLRFDLTGYPASAPTATPWAQDTDQILPLELRPKGERLSRIFRTDWKHGTALYAPFDRVALNSHSNWRRRPSIRTWDATKDLAWILRYLGELLNGPDYTGI